MKKQERGLFDEEYKLEKISKKGDPLEKLNRLIDFEQFRPLLNEVFKQEHRGIGGAKPYDYVKMFKILILQRYYNIGDGQTEYQINDRLSFMRFLDLTLGDSVPDEKTIWLFRSTLTKSGVIEKIFDQFADVLAKKGLIVNAGTIIDASFVEVPRQRNSRKENETIKNGDIPSKWKSKPRKMHQKDVDARWTNPKDHTEKNEETYFGYKDHVKIDKGSKLIQTFSVTDASVHDSQEVEELITESDAHHEFYGDGAYSGDPIRRILKQNCIRNRIYEKGYRGKPLTIAQQEKNRKKSAVRARVEHVFGFWVSIPLGMENSMHGMYIRCVGIVRATGIIGLMNLTYNMFRSMHLVKYKKRVAYV